MFESNTNKEDRYTTFKSRKNILPSNHTSIIWTLIELIIIKCHVSCLLLFWFAVCCCSGSCCWRKDCKAALRPSTVRFSFPFKGRGMAWVQAAHPQVDFSTDNSQVYCHCPATIQISEPRLPPSEQRLQFTEASGINVGRNGKTGPNVITIRRGHKKNDDAIHRNKNHHKEADYSRFITTGNMAYFFCFMV